MTKSKVVFVLLLLAACEPSWPESSGPAPAGVGLVPLARIDSFEPMIAKAGERVTVRGENFPPEAVLLFANQHFVPLARSATLVVFDVPKGAYTDYIHIVAGPQVLTSSERLTIP